MKAYLHLIHIKENVAMQIIKEEKKIINFYQSILQLRFLNKRSQTGNSKAALVGI